MALTKNDMKIIMGNVRQCIQDAGANFELPENRKTFSREDMYQAYYMALVVAEGAFIGAMFAIDADVKASQKAEKLQDFMVHNHAETAQIIPAPSPLNTSTSKHLNTSAKPARAKQNA
jgi:hypothetical protein